jgi:type VI secretion system ImpJ/VasE family protein
MDAIHFNEGLFLQQHHLQMMQRHLLSRIGAVRPLLFSFPYGLIESQVSAESLKNQIVRFDRLHAMMPSGLEVRFPDNADIPSLSIKQAFEAKSGSMTIFLAVPLWNPERANVVTGDGKEDWMVKSIFRIAEVQQADENTGQNPRSITVRRINARLIVDGDDTTDMEVLPVLRVVRGVGEEVGAVRQDPNFIPPAMLVRGSPVLRDMLREFANQLEASRTELALQVTRGGFSVDTMRGAQFEQCLRLRTISRSSARISSLLRVNNLTPFDMYLDLRELLAELGSMYPDKDQQLSPSLYDHDKPGICFQDLTDKIRGLLRGAVTARFMKVDFKSQQNMFLAGLTEEQFTQPNEYYVAVRTREDPLGLAKLVENQDQFQVAAPTMVGKRIFGLKLQEERYPPVELPAQAGLHYFRVNRQESQRMWDRIKEEKAMGVRWLGMENSDFALTLYMTVPG